MRGRLLVPALLVLAVSFGSTARAQSLADVAKQEQERRKTVKDPGITLTNKDLPNAPHTAAPPADKAAPSGDAAGAATSGAAGANDTGKQAVGKDAAADAGKEKTQDKPKDQKYWTDRMTDLRTTLSRDQLYADALQSRINALTTDFVNRDDPLQRAVVGQDRQKALDELGRLKDTIAKDRQAITDAEEEARRSNVPAGWLR